MNKIVTVPTREHPSNLDLSATMVDGVRNVDWTVYRVKGGYLLTARGRAVRDLFASQAEAVAAVPDLLAALRSAA